MADTERDMLFQVLDALAYRKFCATGGRIVEIGLKSELLQSTGRRLCSGVSLLVK